MILRRVCSLFIPTLKHPLNSRLPRFRLRSQNVPEQRIEHLHVRFVEAFVFLVVM
jgi:hypothetical protein